MNKTVRHYVKTINMCALYSGGRRKSRKLAKKSKGRIPARKAARLWKDSLIFRQFVKSFDHAWLYGASPSLIVHDEMQFIDVDFHQLEMRALHWHLTH